MCLDCNPQQAPMRKLDSQAPVLVAKSLHRYLGSGPQRVHALRGVDLEIQPGTLYAISGPSGCGKSTLLYLLGLLDRQDSGEIWLQNRAMDSISEGARTHARKQEIGFVFQFHFLIAEFSAAENIMLPMLKQGQLSEKQMRERAHELLDRVGLSHKATSPANQLSGGEQQRVAIARALANKPALILADEPTGNLDVKNSKAVLDLLKSLSKEHGKAVIVVTHNPEIAKNADKELRMQDGQFSEGAA